jgi:hypothetical protein
VICEEQLVSRRSACCEQKPNSLSRLMRNHLEMESETKEDRISERYVAVHKSTLIALQQKRNFPLFLVVPLQFDLLFTIIRSVLAIKLS